MLDVPVSPAEYAAVLRQDFCSFLDRCFQELNPQTPFLMNWHVEVMASKLDALGTAAEVGWRAVRTKR